MTNLCREAAYGPVREAASSIQHISADEVSQFLSNRNCSCDQYLSCNSRVQLSVAKRLVVPYCIIEVFL